MSQEEAAEAAEAATRRAAEEPPRPTRRPRDKHLGHNAEVTYNEEDRIGQGQFGTVYKGCLTRDKQVVAVKVFRDVVLAGRTSTTTTTNTNNNNNSSTSEGSERRVLIPSEVDTLWSLRSERCPNILYVHSVWNNHKHSRAAGREETVYVIVSEYCAGGDLQHWLLTKGSVSEVAARSLMYQLANALLFLKRHNVLHRDIKPANLLLTSRNLERAVLKVADFGMAKLTRPNNNNNNNGTNTNTSAAAAAAASGASNAANNNNTTTSSSSTTTTTNTPNLEESGMCDTDQENNSPHNNTTTATSPSTTAAAAAGSSNNAAVPHPRPPPHHSLAMRSATLFHSELGTPMYMSPERIARRPYGYKADVYSAGMVLYELMTGHVVRASRPSQLLSAVPAAMQQLVQRHSPSLPAWVDLLVRMTEPDPERRLSAEEVVRHAWFTAPLATASLANAPPLPPLSVELPQTSSSQAPAAAAGGVVQVTATTTTTTSTIVGSAEHVSQPPDAREKTATPPREESAHSNDETTPAAATTTTTIGGDEHGSQSAEQTQQQQDAVEDDAEAVDRGAEPEATQPSAPPAHAGNVCVATGPSEEAQLSPHLAAAPMPTWWRVVAAVASNDAGQGTSHVRSSRTASEQLSVFADEDTESHVVHARLLPAACGPHIVTNAIRSYVDCVVHEVLDSEADPVKALVLLGYLFEMMQSAFTLYIQEIEQHGGAEVEANSNNNSNNNAVQADASRAIGVVSRDYGPLQETWQRLKLTFCTLECSVRQRLPQPWLHAALQWRRQASTTLPAKGNKERTVGGSNDNTIEGADAQEQNTTPLMERTNVAKTSLSCPLAEAPLLTSALTLSTLSELDTKEEGGEAEDSVLQETNNDNNNNSHATTNVRRSSSNNVAAAAAATMTCARAESVLFERAMHCIQQQAFAEVTEPDHKAAQTNCATATDDNAAEGMPFCTHHTNTLHEAQAEDKYNSDDDDDDYGRAIALLRVLVQEVVLSAAEVGLRQAGPAGQDVHEASADVKGSAVHRSATSPTTASGGGAAEPSQQLFLLRVPLLCTLSSEDSATVELALRKVIAHKHTLHHTSQAVVS